MAHLDPFAGAVLVHIDVPDERGGRWIGRKLVEAAMQAALAGEVGRPTFRRRIIVHGVTPVPPPVVLTVSA